MRQFGVSVKCTGPVVCKFPKPAPGEELITGTSGDQKNEEAGFRHLPGICVNFILEYQNAKAGPGHTAQSATVTGGQISVTRLDTYMSHTKGKALAMHNYIKFLRSRYKGWVCWFLNPLPVLRLNNMLMVGVFESWAIRAHS